LDARNERDVFAAEFAKLVDSYTPSRTEAASKWLGRLPSEAFYYYRSGIATFGTGAGSPIERRGRLYLIHTALVFMWMSWGEETARERFRSHPQRGVRRTASLVTLECYRRGGIVARYEAPGWFFRPVADWPVTLISAAVRTEEISKNSPSKDSLARKLSERSQLETTVESLRSLRNDHAVPSLRKLSFPEG
jgi:hypothetical protein